MARQARKKSTNIVTDTKKSGISTYTVQPGETIYTIALKLKRDVNSLIALNGSTVNAGQSIIVG